MWNFKLACETNGIDRSVEMGHCSFYIKESESSTLHSRLNLKHEARARVAPAGKSTLLPTYTKVDNYLMGTM